MSFWNNEDAHNLCFTATATRSDVEAHRGNDQDIPYDEEAFHETFQERGTPAA